MVDNYNFNVVPNDEQEEFKVEFGEVFKVVETDFNKLQNRPSYAGTTMTGDTNIPEVPTAVSQLTNDADYQTWAEVNSAIGVEAKARGDADEALQTAIGVVDGKVADEKTAREQTDGVLQNNIEAEQTARQNADIGLQGQIDAITSASDVVDIVGTYAELQQYSTAKIKDNDVIKVLQDETHNNAMSYYRWSTSTSTWSYIGSEGPYYTKSESDTLLLAKQNKLTAGDNITIANNVISATDTNTTYTAGNAITIDSTDNNRIDAAIYPADFFTADATTSGTGSSITLNDTIPVKLGDVKLDGDTTQQTYSGKNLLPSNGLTVLEQDGITFTPVYNDNNELLYINANGTYLGSNSSIYYSIGRISFISGETYTCSGCDTGSNATYRIWVESSSSKGAFPSGKLLFSSDGPHTETASADENNVRVSIQVYKDKPLDNVKFYPQIELSSGTTTYEPYVGGTASPNPDYPQDVQVVTGEQTVWVHGKNLFDEVEADMAVIGLGSHGRLLTSTTRCSTKGFLTVKPNTTYTVSAVPGDSNKRLQVFDCCYSEKDESTFVGIYPEDKWYNLPFSFTTGDGCNYARLGFRYSDNSSMTTSDVNQVQLEESSTATDYEPYQSYTVDLSSIELCKIGDYQDYIYKSGDDWYVHRAIEKVSLDGSTGGYNSSENWYYASFTNLSKPTPLTSGRIISNYFTESDSAYMHSNKTVNGLCAINSNTHIVIRNTNYSDAGSYQTWLGTTTPIFYYALATPTDTKITDNTLIGQLNALYGAQGYDDKTILTVSATGTNLPAILEVSAFAKSLKGLVGVIGRSEAN